MDFCIDTKELQNIVKVLGITTKVNTIDTTGRILIEASNDGFVNFVSNNLSIGCSIKTDKVSVNEPGRVSIVYSKIKSFVTSFRPWDDISGVKEFNIHSNDKNVFINVFNVLDSGKSTKGKLVLDNFDSDSIKSPTFNDQPNFVLNSEIFKAALSKVLYSIEPNNTVQALQGMNINFNEEYIRFVGTNGKTLSEYEVANTGNLKEGTFILKYDFLMGLRRAISEETQLFFDIDDHIIKVSFNNTVFWGRKIVGHEFPTYRKVLEDFKYEVIVDKEVFISSLKPMIDVLNGDDYNRVTIEIKNDTLTFKNDVSNFVYDLNLEYDGDFVIDLNGNYLLQTIDVLKDDKLFVRFSDENGSFIFDSFNFKNQKSLIRPIRRRKG